MLNKTVSEQTMNARARRAAKKVGLMAVKSKKCLGSVDNFGGFAIIDQGTNVVVMGARFDLTASDVIDYCNSD